jgi:hypothetical protein
MSNIASWVAMDIKYAKIGLKYNFYFVLLMIV